MGFEHLSSRQLIVLWSELEQAYYGDNSFGGDTAEIYAFTLMRYNPTYSFGVDSPTFIRAEQERQQEAREALDAVCNLFAEMRGVKISIDGIPAHKWRHTAAAFDHRVHIKVEHIET